MSANIEKSVTGLRLPKATTKRFDSYKNHVSFVAPGEKKEPFSFKSKIPKFATNTSFDGQSKLTDNCSTPDFERSEAVTPRLSVVSSLPEYVEVPNFKALPYKKKAGFFVK